MEREKFGSRMGFILVSAGCAIGLGNVWKFPYMCGQLGGAAFIVVYILFLGIMGFPIMVCEFAVGRGSRKSCASSFRVLQPQGGKWHNFGYMAMAGNYLLMMFYTMVAGWMLYYCYQSVMGVFSAPGMTPEAIAGKFTDMVGSPSILFLWTVITVALSFGICSLGLKKGVEKITKVMMICLLALIVLLAARSLTLEGARAGVRFYLVPNKEVILEKGIGNMVFGAMSQAFFTLSIGIGSMAIFGSYMDKKRSLTGETISITLLDTFVALMAGLIVIPACFSFGIEPDAGPPLIFMTLPNIFSRMPLGRLWGSLFFLFLSFAAISTVTAVFENIISFSIDLWGWSRGRSVTFNLAAMTILSLPCILGFNVLSGVSPLGPGSGIMDLEDFLVSNNLLPLGSLVYLLFCTSKRGWGWEKFTTESNEGEGFGFPAGLRIYMTYILPIIIVVIYLKGYYDMFYARGMNYFVPWMIVAICLLGITTFFTRGRTKETQDSI